MAALCTYLDNQSKRDDAFVVSLEDTSVTEENIKKVYFLSPIFYVVAWDVT